MAQKYTRAQRRAYQSGKGYAIASAKRGINFKNDSLKESFQAGYAKGNQMIRRNPLKYSDLSKSNNSRRKRRRSKR